MKGEQILRTSAISDIVEIHEPPVSVHLERLSMAMSLETLLVFLKGQGRLYMEKNWPE